MADRDSQTFKLPDGRLLGYAEFGLPNGYPILLFHGLPSSRAEGIGMDKIALRRRLRILALDRPGFGLSTFQSGRRITDWPADVAAFAAHAGLERFMVLGVSGGGPYALACAGLLPSQMISGVGLIAPAGPWAAGTKELQLYQKMVRVWATWWPSSMRIVSDVLVGVAKWLVSTKLVAGWIDRSLNALVEIRKKKKAESQTSPLKKEEEEDDDDERSPQERREQLLRIILFEPFVQGSRAMVQEAAMLSDPDWGFKLEDVQYDPIRIWHGTKDKNAPIEQIRYMAERLPHCQLTEFKTDNHYSMGYHLEEIFDELASNLESNESKKNR